MYPMGELRGLVPIPYVALQDTRHGHPGGKPFRPPFNAARRRPRPVGGLGERPGEPPKPRLLDRVRHAIETSNYSRRTEKAYVQWTKRYIFFHGKRHPAEMGAAEVAAFLTSLAVQGKVAASTQNQALIALLFLYREVLTSSCRGSTTSSGPNGPCICPWC